MVLHWSVETKRLAKQVFGRPLRVALADWILDREGKSFYLLEAQTSMLAVGEAGSAVSTELRRFAEMGLLTESRVDSRVYFTPTDVPLWKPFISMIEVLSALDHHEVASS